MKIRYGIFIHVIVFMICNNINMNQLQAYTVFKNPVYDTLSPRELALPEIPSSLRNAPDRAAYLVLHFWESMDFRDTTCSHDRVFMEQNFANFIALFPHAKPSSLALAVKRLMKLAETDSTAYLLLTEITGKYLYETDSPMLCEEYFILFLEEIVRSPILGKYDKIRPSYLLEVARKNRPGMQAADFTYLTREGKREKLSHTPGKQLLLLFYDLDCEHCKEVMKELQANALFRQQVHDKSLTVLAIYTDGDHMIWERTKDSLPAEWITGFDNGDIGKKELYVLPAMPTLYLLDQNKKVLLKNAPLQTLFDVLNTSIPTNNRSKIKTE